MKKLKITIITSFFLFLFSFSSVLAVEEVPFEVVKTKVNAEVNVPTEANAIVVDGKFVGENTYSINGKVVDHRKKGEYDHRVKVPMVGVTYKFEFWNVGQMGGEKGFFFKSNYGDAKLTITYKTGQAYKMVGTGEKWGILEKQEKKEVSTPYVKKTFEYDLIFTGGPFGVFMYKQKDGGLLQVAKIAKGEVINMETTPEPLYLTHETRIPIKNSSAFEKWMELIGYGDGTCADPKNPTTDSGIRFNDYSGEVMVRPCNDEDSWYGAELDMVLHIDDHIKTGDDSTASLGLADMTTFVMKPESEIVLATQSRKRNILKLVWGKIRANVKRMVKDGSMDVEMSQAVAGIKGTTFVVEDNGKKSTLKVIEGHVEFTSKTTGKKIMVNGGEMVTATKTGLGDKKKLDLVKENQEWDKINENLKNNSDEKIKSKITQKNNKKNSSFNFIITLLALLIILGYFIIRKKKKNLNK